MTRIIVLIMLLAAQLLSAQNFNGVVTYKTDRKMDFRMDSTKVSSEMQKQLHEMMRKQFQKEFTLRFNTSESTYKEEASLEAPQPAGMQVIMLGGGEADELYKNIKEERFSSKRDMMGKTFLVKDQLNKFDWELINETKKIGNYVCFKAEAKRTVRDFAPLNEETTEEEPEEREITITAWYTLEIPIGNGPENYWGLPGLILETNDGSQRILCSKIVLNPKKKIEITEPVKGKIVNEEKYEEIMQKKVKEMRDRMPRRDENSFQIRVRG